MQVTVNEDFPLNFSLSAFGARKKRKQIDEKQWYFEFVE